MLNYGCKNINSKQMTEHQLWVKRHRLVQALRAQVSQSTMNLIGELVMTDLRIERIEKKGFFYSVVKFLNR